MIADFIYPDVVLAEALNGNIIIEKVFLTDGIEEYVPFEVPVFSSSGMSNENLPEAFVQIRFNGAIKSVTIPMGIYTGNLAIIIYLRPYQDMSANLEMYKSLVQQIEEKAINRAIGGYFFAYTPNNVITPPTTSASTGYTTMILNVSFRTTGTGNEVEEPIPPEEGDGETGDSAPPEVENPPMEVETPPMEVETPPTT